MQNTLMFQSKFKQIITLVIGLFLLSSASFAEQPKQAEIVKMDRIVAIVDQVVITENELADRIKTVTAQLEKQGTELPPPTVLEKQILERLYKDIKKIIFKIHDGP